MVEVRILVVVCCLILLGCSFNKLHLSLSRQCKFQVFVKFECSVPKINQKRIFGICLRCCTLFDYFRVPLCVVSSTLWSLNHGAQDRTTYVVVILTNFLLRWNQHLLILLLCGANCVDQNDVRLNDWKFRCCFVGAQWASVWEPHSLLVISRVFLFIP